ncbi:MAG: SpoIIE family protein phosphatase, partial [Bdellovibrionales bacterium]|nr:SpoIIE family protein phosphatase [Bdellovibrionales bacterium]
DLEATMPFVLRNYFSLAGNVLFNAVIHANRKVLQENKSKNVHEKGGASLIAGFLDGDLLALANVGSCSAWLFREGRVCDLVMPRSYGRLVDPFEGGRSIPHIQAPLMAMGMSEDLEPEICEYRVRSGDWLLLATDGVDLRVRDRILELYRNPKPLSEAASDVTEVLNGLQCSDNASGSLMIF